ncbi:hypothetical protein K2173_016118 [Erythroxylum novogranatense]|uniref:Retrotransposon Copia-like N-terminal domain-containing protein n=1 Tax=Erythroxylum novogranatense TaxID=1862640 RepID=A0AAV8SFA5_9ROSI|nr:hypothetical protein K2173_016118 [Erythroxylum novogranatense]
MDGFSHDSPTGSTLDHILRASQEENQTYLQGSDYPGMSLVVAVLNGNNFLSWSRSVKIALGAEMKLGFVDGTCQKPSSGSAEYDKWVRTDYMVRLWLLNSMSKDIVEAFIYTNSARELWSELEERFGENNGPLLYHIQRQISVATQGNQSVAKYFTSLKKLWDELWCLMPIPQCTCGAVAQCTCGAPRALADLTSLNQLMQFLMGLNESYDHVRNQILVIEPLPTINKAYSMVLRVEKQREVQMVFSEGVEHNAMFVSKGYNKKVGDGGGKQFKNKWGSIDKSELYYSYCKKNGHVK